MEGSADRGANERPQGGAIVVQPSVSPPVYVRTFYTAGQFSAPEGNIVKAIDSKVMKEEQRQAVNDLCDFFKDQASMKNAVSLCSRTVIDASSPFKNQCRQDQMRRPVTHLIQSFQRSETNAHPPFRHNCQDCIRPLFSNTSMSHTRHEMYIYFSLVLIIVAYDEVL